MSGWPRKASSIAPICRNSDLRPLCGTLNNVQIDLGASNSLLKSEGEPERLKLASATTSAFGAKQTFRGSVPMSAFGGHSNLLGLFAGNGRGQLGNKAGPALEGHVAPQPSYGNDETIPDANQKVDVHCAPKYPTN